MALRMTRSLSRLAACLTLAAPAFAQVPSGAADPEAEARPAEPSASAPLSERPADAAAADPGLDTVAPPEDDAAAAPDPLVTRLETRLEFDQLVTDEEYATAQQVGERLIELTEQEFGPLSEQAAEAY